MPSGLRDKLLHPATIIATCALLVALGGSGYAISQLPKNSVGTAQIKSGAVASAKIKKDAVTGAKVKDGSLLARDFKSGQLPRGERGPAGPAEGPAGGALAGAYPNPRLAGDALGSSRSFSPLESCTAFSLSLPAPILTFRDVINYTFYSTSETMACGLSGVPTGARITRIDAVVLDADVSKDVLAQIITLDTRPAGTGMKVISNAQSTTGVLAAMQTLTLTPTTDVRSGDAAVPILDVRTPGNGTSIRGYTAFYTLDP